MVQIEIIQLNRSDTHALFYTVRETCVVILTGVCDISAASGAYHWSALGKRSSVFEMPPDAVYIPCNMPAIITAVSDSLKVAVISVDAEKKLEPFVVRSSEIVCQLRGKKEWKRSVYDIISAGHRVNSILVGETIHTHGVWSGYPPHKHDTDDLDKESQNQEVYYVEIEPKEAFAVFVQYGEGWEQTTLLRSGDSIAVEKGFHAIVSAGGAKLYYLWALDSHDRRFYCKADDRYAWVEEL